LNQFFIFYVSATDGFIAMAFSNTIERK